MMGNVVESEGESTNENRVLMRQSQENEAPRLRVNYTQISVSWPLGQKQCVRCWVKMLSS